MAVLLPLLSATIGGFVGWGISGGGAPFHWVANASSSPDPVEVVRLESLRRSRLAFLNLGFDRKSSLIREIDAEISVAECSLQKITVTQPPATSLSESSSTAEEGSSQRERGARAGVILGFILGAPGAAIYGWRRRGAPQALKYFEEGIEDLPIPILGAIPEGAFDDR